MVKYPVFCDYIYGFIWYWGIFMCAVHFWWCDILRIQVHPWGHTLLPIKTWKYGEEKFLQKTNNYLTWLNVTRLINIYWNLCVRREHLRYPNHAHHYFFWIVILLFWIRTSPCDSLTSEMLKKPSGILITSIDAQRDQFKLQWYQK